MSKNVIVGYAHAYVGHGRNAGAETTMHDILKFLVRAGWEAHVIISNPSSGMVDYVIDGVQVHPQENRRTILHWIPRASVVLTHLECSERAAILCKKYRTPLVQLIHNDMDITKGYVAMGCDMAIFNTRWVEENFKDYNGLRIVVHPPILCQDYAFDDFDKVDAKYVTMVNLWPNKGSDVFYSLAEKFPDLKFMGVMGGYGEQDVRSGFDNVTFHGHVMDMRPIYDETRIVLMPSKYESYGRIAVEAASRGIPSIVCPTPGLLEALDDAGIYAVSVDQFSTHLKRLQHWKAYKSASMKSSKRFETIQNNTFVELESLLTHLNGLAETGRLLRGW